MSYGEIMFVKRLNGKSQITGQKFRCAGFYIQVDGYFGYRIDLRDLRRVAYA